MLGQPGSSGAAGIAPRAVVPLLEEEVGAPLGRGADEERVGPHDAQEMPPRELADGGEVERASFPPRFRLPR